MNAWIPIRYSKLIKGKGLVRPGRRLFRRLRERSTEGFWRARAPNSSCTPFPFDGSKLLIVRWPSFRRMTDRQLTAVYEYLSAIPCIRGRDSNELPNLCQ